MHQKCVFSVKYFNYKCYCYDPMDTTAYLLQGDINSIILLGGNVGLGSGRSGIG